MVLFACKSCLQECRTRKYCMRQFHRTISQEPRSKEFTLYDWSGRKRGKSDGWFGLALSLSPSISQLRSWEWLMLYLSKTLVPVFSQYSWVNQIQDHLDGLHARKGMNSDTTWQDSKNSWNSWSSADHLFCLLFLKLIASDNIDHERNKKFLKFSTRLYISKQLSFQTLISSIMIQVLEYEIACKNPCPVNHHNPCHDLRESTPTFFKIFNTNL